MSTVPLSPATSKRHSSGGPRPLQLVDASGCQSTTRPLSASYLQSFRAADPSPPPSVTNNTKRHPQRQSSISYYSRDNERISSPFVPHHALSRSMSVGVSSPKIGGAGGDMRNAGSASNGSEVMERPPLTLAEKHADLLQFIAQKEAKCLDLRSQLAMHEAELLQLKRKWERIVSRGFQKGDGVSEAHVNPNPGNSVVLEGIKEGVQGVSRFIAAGLTDLSSNPSPPMRLSSAPKRGHSANQSSSSASTNTTDTKSSARLSQSSASSLGDETLLSPREEEEDQELIVRDTGATPTMSPNPAFKYQKEKKERRSEATDGQHFSNRNGAANIHRRRSQDVSLPSPSNSSLSLGSSSTAPCEDQTSKARKRTSMNGLPPVSSIPGLGSISVTGNSSTQPISSWMGSATKKWEELQRGSSFSKGQKRASVLLSDVSHSIVSALSPQSLTAPPFLTPPLTSSGKTSPSSVSSAVSLLDIDDLADEDYTTRLGSVMKPDKTSPKLQPPSSAPIASAKTGDTKTEDEGDDEWNW